MIGADIKEILENHLYTEITNIDRRSGAWHYRFTPRLHSLVGYFIKPTYYGAYIELYAYESLSKNQVSFNLIEIDEVDSLEDWLFKIEYKYIILDNLVKEMIDEGILERTYKKKDPYTVFIREDGFDFYLPEQKYRVWIGLSKDDTVYSIGYGRNREDFTGSRSLFRRIQEIIAIS
ncbi:MAG: hypothetical protein J6I84_02905 [Bacilli bacterium]|nr:hypothetical protein [Bacilli bacterium]